MIDIIIPVYNSSKTICKTLNSILEQENNEDLIIYIIDDGSSETYDDVISFFSKFLNINYYKLDKNSGPGVARQFGLDKSSNEYIVFIDSDDTFHDTDSVLKLYNSIYNYDMVFGQMLDKRYEKNDVVFHENCLHGKMYRRSFIENNKMKFNGMRSHEDNAFNQLYLSLSQNINYLEEIIYEYNYNANSITATDNSTNSLKEYIKSMNWLFGEIDKRNNINKYQVGITIFNLHIYCYFNYLLDESNNEFVFRDLTFLKRMYEKYIDNIDYSDKLRIYSNYNYPVIPTITFDDFIRKIN